MLHWGEKERSKARKTALVLSTSPNECVAQVPGITVTIRGCGCTLKWFINKQNYEKNTSEEAKIILSVGFISYLWSKVILSGS